MSTHYRGCVVSEPGVADERFDGAGYFLGTGFRDRVLAVPAGLV